MPRETGADACSSLGAGAKRMSRSHIHFLILLHTVHALCLWYVPGDSHHECCFIVACLLLGAQADTAGGENKNQWVMRYLSLLVERGCFRSTCLALLQVGHTHEDIDAIFVNHVVRDRQQNFGLGFAYEDGRVPRS